jgi:hypothetical protein
MARRTPRRLDIYSELFPASSAIIIGLGVVTLAMGWAVGGVAFVLAGVGLGVAGALSKAPTRKAVRRAR